MHTVREKRRGGARPAALAVAVIAAMLVPAGAAAADTTDPTAESGVVAEQPTATESAAPAEPAPEPATEPAPVAPATTEQAPAPEPAPEPAPQPATQPEAPPADATATTSSTTSSTSSTSESELPTMSGFFSFSGTTFDEEEWVDVATVATTLTAVDQGWPVDADIHLEWWVGDVVVGYGPQYTPRPEDIGRMIEITWTVVAPGYQDANGGASVASTTVAGAEQPATMEGDLIVTGTTDQNGEIVAPVGHTLSAALDDRWPAGAEVSWSWRVEGVLRSVSSTFTPDLSDLGGKVWVYASVTAPGYEHRVAGVRAAQLVVEGTAVPQGTVTYKGGDHWDVVLGTTTSVDLAGWPAGAAETVVWSVDGYERGEGRTFTPTAKDLGGYLEVFVSVTAPGMTPFTDHRWMGTVVTTPTVSVPSSSITVGDIATIPVAVTGPQGGPVATGVVSVTLTPRSGGMPLVLPSASLVDGVATFTAANLPVGTYTVSAAYTAKEIQYAFFTLMTAEHVSAYRSATGSGVLTVGAAAATLTAPGTVRAAVATRATFEATLATNADAPTGSWTVREGGSVLAHGEVRKGGRIAVTLPVLSVGTHTLVLEVPATPWAAAASATVTVVVTGEPAQVGTTPTVGTVLDTPKAATVPGQQMELVAEGFEPGETVAFYLHSEPMFLGTAVAGADGVARLLATVPAGAPVGSHTVIATGGTSGRWATLAVELAVPAAVTPVANPVVAAPAATAAASPALAVTGSQSGTLMAGAWLMLLVGGSLVLVARRVRATR
ncbi:hypothetical protein [Cellulomonas sp. NPDC058312]|uniref:hypothetical protein n=1 Tax=Cellulomonas sp. NPDC058312 TaxID=3346441 RepID=UPI0036E89B72